MSSDYVKPTASLSSKTSFILHFTYYIIVKEAIFKHVFFFRDGMEGESQRPTLSPPARVPENSPPVHQEEQILRKFSCLHQ